MKPVFKCDYCSKMGTEEEIREHEEKCMRNYNKKSCYTCVHKRMKPKDGEWFYRCEVGTEIPERHIIEFCSQYERYEEKESLKDLADAFSGWFKY